VLLLHTGWSYQLYIWVLTWGPTRNYCGTKWLPWQHQLPSNWATKICNILPNTSKTHRSINFIIGTRLQHVFLVTWPNFGVNRSEVMFTGLLNMYSKKCHNLDIFQKDQICSKTVDIGSLRTLEQNHRFGQHLYKDKYMKFFFKFCYIVIREFKSREVAQAPIYVIVHSLLELSFCAQPFPTPSGWLCRCVLTLVMALKRSINFVLLLLYLRFLRPQVLRKRLRFYHLGQL